MIERRYVCDMCRDYYEPRRLVGLHWQGTEGWKEVSSEGTERHLCFRCLSSIQGLKQRCGGGYQCPGGPLCASDHK